MAMDLDLTLAAWFSVFAEEAPAEAGDERLVSQLVERARGGDRQAQHELYRLHAPSVFRAVRGLARTEAEAEDVAQEAFVSAYSRLDRYKPRAGARFASWLAAIALNEARRRTRWTRRAVLDPDAGRDDAAEARDPGEALDLARRKRKLLAALGELAPREREVVTLRYGAELSAAEVAGVVGVSEANVRKICERQRKALLDKLQEAT